MDVNSIFAGAAGIGQYNMTMAQFDVAEAKARFSELVQKAMLGEEVIVAKENKPVVKIVPIKPLKRKPGMGKGIWISPDFDEPLDDLSRLYVVAILQRIW